MARTYYGKRKYAPKQCPTCGQNGIQPRQGTLTAESLSDLFGNFYKAWQVLLEKKRPGWNIPSWYGFCGTCAMRDELFAPNTILSLFKKRA